MDLVTITCNRDVNVMLLQAKSVQQYLKAGTTHWVIINEPEESLFEVDWNYLLSPYYKNHDLKIIYGDPEYWKLIHNGWIIQQLHKLEISRIVNKDYMLFDSKNFFVVPTDLEEWTHEGCGVLISKEINLTIWNLWDQTNSRYSLETGIPKLTEYYAAETPFIIRDKIVKQAINREGFSKWFVDCYKFADASEFIYYSYFLKPLDFKYSRRHHSLWPEICDIEHWFEQEDFKIMEISGIHRGWFEQASVNDKKKVKDWLASLNLIDENTATLFD